MKRAVIAFLAGMSAMTMCLAHEDRAISVNADGSLAGLPTEYVPAKLQVAFTADNGNGPPVTSVLLRLGKHQTKVPVCVTGFLLSKSLKDVRVSASWYHDESVVPYYVSIMFFDPSRKDADGAAAPGFSMLFNLRTAKLMEMDVRIARDNGEAVQHIPVDLRARCDADELKEFSALR